MSLREFRQNRSSGTYRQNTQDLHGLAAPVCEMIDILREKTALFTEQN